MQHWSCHKQNCDQGKNVIDGNNHTFAFKLSEDEKLFLNTNNTSLLVDCGATTHILNKDENFIYIDSTFKPADHDTEHAELSKSNNVALKRKTVIVFLQTQNKTIVTVNLGNIFFKK